MHSTIRITEILFIILLRSTVILSRSVNQSIEIHQILVGSRIVFECPLIEYYKNVRINPKSNDNVKVIFWSKHPSSLISVMDISNNKNISKSKEYAQIFQRFRKKVSHVLELENEISKLIIDDVSLTDEGLYRCRVDYRHSRTIEIYHQLELIMPPKKLIILDKNQRKISHSEYRIGPFDEGTENLTIICQTKLVKPSPKLYWFENSTLIDDSYQLMQNISTNNSKERLLANDKRFVLAQNSLTLLGPIKRQDLNRKFVCVGQNTAVSIHKPASVTVQLDLNLSPVSVEITTQNTFTSGQKVALVCRSFGSRPRAQLLWFKNRIQILDNIENRYDTGNNITYSVVHFKVQPEDNGSEIQCKAINVKMKNSLRNSLIDSIILNVQFSPIMRLITNSSMKENSNIYLKCLILSNPKTPFDNIEWQLNNKTLQISKNIFVKNDLLILKNVSETDSGSYRCIAFNSIGRSSSEQFPISVQFAPKCSNNTEQILHVSYESLNSSIVECHVRAYPQVVYYDWLLNETSIGHLSYTTRGGLLSSLYYRPRTRYDYGNITCFARNSVGTMKEPCRFRIVPQGRPSPITSCTLISHSRIEASLKCRFTFDGGLESGCKVQLFLLNDPLWNGTLWPATSFRKGFICKSDITFNSTKLMNITDYKIRGLVQSFNRIGNSATEFEFHSTLYFNNIIKSTNNQTIEKSKNKQKLNYKFIKIHPFVTFCLLIFGTISLFVCSHYYCCFHKDKIRGKANNIQMFMRNQRQLSSEFV